MAWRRHVVKERVARRLVERRLSEREQAAQAAAQAGGRPQQEDTLEVRSALPWLAASRVGRHPNTQLACCTYTAIAN